MNLADLLDTRLADAQCTSRAPSAAAAVIGDGEVVWSGATANINGRPDGERATTTTQYRIGSITKTFTAVLTLRLVDDGLVTLTDPVSQHLPELADRLPGVRVCELLTHGAGLPAETEGPWWERSAGRTWTQLQDSIRPIHRPSRRFHYSNIGFAVAGELVARLRKSTWWDRLCEDILKPLEMHDTSYAPTDAAAPGLAVHPYADLLHDEPATDTLAMAPAGQLWSTVHDLPKFATFLARGDERVLSDDLRREMQIPALIDDEPGRGIHPGLWLRPRHRQPRRPALHRARRLDARPSVRVADRPGDRRPRRPARQQHLRARAGPDRPRP